MSVHINGVSCWLQSMFVLDHERALVVFAGFVGLSITRDPVATDQGSSMLSCVFDTTKELVQVGGNSLCVFCPVFAGFILSLGLS